MPWVRFDDQFPYHRKVARLSDPAFRLHVSAIFWSALNLTDGWVPAESIPDIAPGLRRLEGLAAELVGRGLWHESNHGCKDCVLPPDGWMVHHYLTYQPSKAQVEKERADARERQRRWRERRSDGKFA